MENYETVALISGILGIYARFNFMQVFRESKQQNIKLEIILYGLFYIVSHAAYLVLDLPIINLLVQMLFFIAIGLQMGLKLRKTLFAMSIIIVIIVVIDSVVFFMTGYVNDSVFIEADYQSEFGIVAVDMITLLVSMTFKNFKNVSKKVDVPFHYWFAVFFFPTTSLLLLVVIFGFSSENKLIVIICTLIILVMNFIVFWLYDRLMWQYEKKLDELIVENMNISYKRQLEMMRASILNIKSFKHDIKKHVVAIDVLIKEERYNDLKDYISNVKGSIENGNMVSNTGNVVIDSIINYEVNASGINPECILFKALEIPAEMNILDYDLTVIFSNVVSNALTAIKNVENGKVKIHLSLKKGVFYIQVENDFQGQIIVENNKLFTTNEDKENHGYGLENVKRSVKKYNGELSMEFSNSKFVTDIIMYEKT